MKQIAHILKFKIISFMRLEKKLTFNIFVKNAGSGLIYAGFAIGAFYFSQYLIHFLLVEIRVGIFLLHEFVSMVMFIFFLSVNLGNIIVSYSTLYKSDEVNFLLTKPVSPTKIFLIKFLDNFFYSSSTLLMILFSLLVGYVVYFKLSVLSFIMILCSFIPFMFSAASLGVIFLLILIRLANRFGVKKVIYGLISCYILTIAFFFQINSPRTIISSVMKYYPFINKDQYLGEFVSPIIKLLPNNWLSQSGYWLIKGEIIHSLEFVFIQIVLSVILFLIAVYLGHRWYFKTWLLNLKISSDYAAERKEIKTIFAFEKKSILKSQSESIIKKDLLLFIRESTQVIHFLVLLFMIVVFVSSVAGIKFVGLGNFYLQTMIYISIFLFNLLLISTLSLRFVFPLISLEGEAFWRIKSAPIQHSIFLKNKLTIFSVIILFIGISLSFFSNYKFGIILTLFSIIITLFASATIISINFGMGGLFANFKEKNAVRLSSSQGATLSFLTNIVYMLFLIIVLFKPLSQLFLSIMLEEHFDLSVFIWSLIPIGIVSTILIYTYNKLAYNSLQKDF